MNDYNERIDQLFAYSSELAAKLSAIEERDRWILVSERLPEDGAEVEFISLKYRESRYLGFYDGDAFVEEHYHVREKILCWRPAREIGELPAPKEEA